MVPVFPVVSVSPVVPVLLVVPVSPCVVPLGLDLHAAVACREAMPKRMPMSRCVCVSCTAHDRGLLCG